MKIHQNQCHIIISISEQLLIVFKGESVLKEYMIASAKNGIGQQKGSECTPLGKHRIAQKIGDNAPINAIFVGRQQQTEIYSEALAKTQANRDWILTRILWLDGLEEGFNSGFLTEVNMERNNSKKNEFSIATIDNRTNAEEKEMTKNEKISCDTKGRYIYIHGCPDSHAMQIPSSHGCIKMRNTDVVELFDMVSVDTKVIIKN